MKRSAAIIFPFVLAFAATSYAYSTTWGTISVNDKVLHFEKVNATSPNANLKNSFFFYTFEFPNDGITNEVEITAIQAVDLSKNATASHGTLIAGGPNTTSAKVIIRSEKSNDIDFQVIVYGK